VATAFRVRTEPRAEQCFGTINREVLIVGQDKYQMTMTALEIDQDSGRFRVISAGGLPMLVLSEGKAPRYVLGRGTPLGTRQFDLGFVDGRLQPGDRCLLFTDGIVEIPVRGRAFGLRRLAKLMEETRPLGLEEVSRTLEAAALSFQPKSAQEDDWTFVLLDWRGRAAS
jgi:serine phosphatase RsbU (regulator of sigma subunit)